MVPAKEPEQNRGPVRANAEDVGELVFKLCDRVHSWYNRSVETAMVQAPSFETHALAVVVRAQSMRL